METLTQEQRDALKRLRERVERGEVSDYYDSRIYRAAYWLTIHAPGLLAMSVLAGALILVGGLWWVFTLPW